MEQHRLIAFLERQLGKIEDDAFDLRLWKDSTLTVLRKSLGPDTPFTSRIEAFDYAESTNYDELYPKQVRDLVSTKQKLKALCRDLIDELRFLEPEEIGSANIHLGRETLQRSAEALRQQFTGSQLAELKKVVREKEGDEREQELLDLVKQFQVDRVQHVVAAMLGSEELWEALT